MRELTRNEIVGAQIREVWQTGWVEWSAYPDDRYSCDSFVETDNGCFFQLGSAETVWNDATARLVRTTPIYQLDKNDLTLIPACYWLNGEKIRGAGLTILEVVTSELFGCPGLILEGRILLIADAYGIRHSVFGAVDYPLDNSFSIEEIHDYWELNPRQH